MANLRDYFLYKYNYIVSVDTAKSRSYFFQSNDLDEDGNKDVILFGFTYPNNNVTTPIPQGSIFYWGTSSGGYNLASATSIALPSTTHPREIAYADFNNDGKLDLFLADHGWDTVPFPGGQNQLILSSESGWVLGTSNLPNRTDFTHCTTVGDINKDGNIDIFLGNVDTSGAHYSASILFGDGKGNFIESTLAVPSEIRDSIRFYAAQLADLNQDGWLDLVIGNSGDIHNSKNQSIVYWNQNGSFENDNSSLIPNGFFGSKNEQILDIQAADVNGDGRKDLVLLSTQNNPSYDGWSLQIITSMGSTFIDITADAFGSNISSMGIQNEVQQKPWIAFIKLVDVNHDGTVDILFDSIASYGLKAPEAQPLIYLNDGFAHFSPIFANDLIDLDSTYKDFFSGASSFFNEDGLSWVNYFSYQDSIYFRELVQVKPLPKIMEITATNNNDTIVGNELNNLIFGLTGNDLIDGGSGFDSAAWKYASNNYELIFSKEKIQVIHKLGIDGSDSLTNIEKLQFTDRAVIIESQSHGSYADLPTELYQFFITAFNAAPGVTYMDQLAEAYRYGLSVKQIVDIFTTKKQFTDVYSPSLSHSDLATQLVNNIVKNSASASAKTEAIADIKGALDIGWTVGDVIFTVFGNLAHKDLSDPNWGNTAKQFNNEIAVAKYYTEVLNQSTTDLETLRDVIQPVTQSTDISSDVVIAQLVGVALMTGGLVPTP